MNRPPAGPAAFFTLILNASPHRDGNVMAMARQFAAGLGGEAEYVHLYDLRIDPCRDCGPCRAGGACPLSAVDDFPGVMARLERADLLVFASPLHFTSLTAPLVAFISRLQAFWPGPPTDGPETLVPPAPQSPRRGVLLLSGGSEYPRMFEPARAVAAAAFKTLRLAFAGMVAAADTDRRPALSQPEVVAALADLAAKLAQPAVS